MGTIKEAMDRIRNHALILTDDLKASRKNFGSVMRNFRPTPLRRILGRRPLRSRIKGLREARAKKDT